MMLSPLKPGDRVALIAPASPFEPEKLSLTCEMIESAGYRLSLGRHLFNRKGYLAGSEGERAEDLIRAIEDPEVGAILCVRGGYGSGRLLPWLPFSLLRKHPKIFMGYSDITFLHLAFRRQMEWPTFHGPNALDMADAPERAENVFKTLRGENPFSWELQDSQILRPGVASGVVVGGNLTCLAHLLGTPYFPDMTGALLLIEDTGEGLYRLDRLIAHLKLAGVLPRLGGLILGRFKNCGESQKIREMVLEQVKDLPFPVIGNLPFGHGSENQVILFGAPFLLNTHQHTLKALQTPFSPTEDRERTTAAGSLQGETGRKGHLPASSGLPFDLIPTPSSGISPVVLDVPSSPRPASHFRKASFASLASPIEDLFQNALKEKTFSGASLLVATPGKILFQGTWGHTRSGGAPVTPYTRFDLASLTKPLITVPLYMRAISRKSLDLDDPLSRFFPTALLPVEKKAITIGRLLNHCSGLPAYEPFYRTLIETPYAHRSAVLLSRILDTPLVDPPGKVCRYSDLGFLLLGIILEMVFESPLDSLAQQLLLQPMHNYELGYCRLKVFQDPTLLPERLAENRHHFAATEYCSWRKRILEGEVHDENAYSLGGVAPHAGLFGTAHGVFRLLSYLWGIYRGAVEDPSWSAEVMSTFWKKQDAVPGSSWALGLDTPSPERSSAGIHFSPRSVGHLGFTGTSFWIDLEKEVMVVLLTNRVHPTRENDRLKAFRPLMHNLVMEAFHVLSGCQNDLHDGYRRHRHGNPGNDAEGKRVSSGGLGRQPLSSHEHSPGGDRHSRLPGIQDGKS